MNYREKIRNAIACPQFGDDHYGEWGALRLDQRKLIKRVLDELDRADEYIKSLWLENEQQKEKIDKAIVYINDLFNVIDYDDEEFITFETLQRILEILGDKENE